MGTHHFGAPRQEIEFLKASHATQTFVETGTFQGATATWAASIFDKVITIEGSPEYFRRAAEKLAPLKNVECMLGDSRSVLPAILNRVKNEHALFWLDAHWMPGSFGETAECPVLDEIYLINQSSQDHVILIDDARLFLAPPPRPHKSKDWPSIGALMNVLETSSGPSRHTIIYHDVLFNVPAALKDATVQFFQDKTTVEMTESPGDTLPIRSIVKRFVKGLIGTRISTDQP